MKPVAWRAMGPVTISVGGEEPELAVEIIVLRSSARMQPCDTDVSDWAVDLRAMISKSRSGPGPSSKC
jgi:hypothetical protein